MRVRLLFVLIAVCSICLPGSALAAQAVKLSSRFEPSKLGGSTTIAIAFKIATPGDRLPPPMSSFELRLPAGVNTAASTLGLATCAPVTLEQHGVGACSPNAVMGLGTAVVGVAVGTEVIFEQVKITIVMAPPTDGHTALSFYANGASPVIAQFLLPGLLLEDSGQFGANVNTQIPIIPGLPGAPDVSLVSLRASIGPKGLTYRKRVHGAVVDYSPEGFDVPSRCPAGGFPFATSLTFQGGETASASSTAPCPPRRRS